MHLGIMLHIQDETAMYPKVWLDNGKLESIAEKRHTALVYREKIYLLADLIRMKIFNKKHIDNLMFIKKYGKHISDMFAKDVHLFSNTSECDFLALLRFYPELIHMWQMECHSVLSDTCCYMDNFKDILSSTSDVQSLNVIICIMTTTARFLENYIIRSKTFDTKSMYDLHSFIIY